MTRPYRPWGSLRARSGSERASSTNRAALSRPRSRRGVRKDDSLLAGARPGDGVSRSWPAMSTTAVDPEEIARVLFGVRASATPLHGEHDLNFRLEVGASRYVLKLHHPDADATALDLQDAVLEALASEPGVPRLLGSRAWGERRARLLSWLDGRPWADGGGDMASLGRVVARVDRALAGFAHPAMCRPHRWDLRNAGELAPWAERLDPAVRRARRADPGGAGRAGAPAASGDSQRRQRAQRAGRRGRPVDRADRLRRRRSGRARVCGLAVAGAYAMQGQPDPARAVVPVVRGYHEVAPLQRRRARGRCSH